ncbi:MAG TPA: cation diffusion facilitator family transporter [Mycobacteriales bacterium]|nr:cation diffusion facilitator family transporter [Mycobacteriales bacterium]
MSASGGKKAIVAALLANSGIAIAKFVGFLITRSSSMLAESVHSVADAGNQGLLLLGQRQARRKSDDDHPFGYGRARFFWAFVVALVLFALGSLFALYEGIEKIRHPHEIESVPVAIGILVLAIGLEIYSFRTAIVEANHVRGDEGWVSFIRHAKSPELPVVLLEDAGALFGLVLALAGVGLSLATGDPVWDAIGTLSIGVLLGVIAAVLAVEMRSLLIGEGASPADAALIRSAMEDASDVRRVIHLKTLYLGPDELLVAAKIEVTGVTVQDVAAVINSTEARIRAAVPTARVIYLEPDVYHSS